MLQGAADEFPDKKSLIDSIWEELLNFPTGVVIQGIQVKEIKQLPLTDEEEIDLPHENQEYLRRIAAYIGKPHHKIYNLTIGLVADQHMKPERLFVNL